jgi:hypothetical protein
VYLPNILQVPYEIDKGKGKGVPHPPNNLEATTALETFKTRWREEAAPKKLVYLIISTYV